MPVAATVAPPPATVAAAATDAPDVPAPEQPERIRTATIPVDLAPVEPARVRVPKIGVDTPLVRLGLNPDRSIEVPTDFSLAGWYTLGPAPGQGGPAVMVGHVDSRRGPAVFFRLRELVAGDAIEVARADGTVVGFTVDRVERHDKDAFPTAAVYGPTDGPELRLITCGGVFNRQTRHYEDNVVVFARVTPIPLS